MTSIKLSMLEGAIDLSIKNNLTADRTMLDLVGEALLAYAVQPEPATVMAIVSAAYIIGFDKGRKEAVATAILGGTDAHQDNATDE